MDLRILWIELTVSTYGRWFKKKAPDEACWLEAHYLPNITTLFFVETLADLEKQARERIQRRFPLWRANSFSVMTPHLGQEFWSIVSCCDNRP